MKDAGLMFYHHFFYGFCGCLFGFIVSIWLLSWASDKKWDIEMTIIKMKFKKHSPILNFNLIVYNILELIGGTGAIGLGILGFYEFFYSFIMACKFVWTMIVS